MTRTSLLSGLGAVFKIYLNVYLVGLVSGLNLGQTQYRPFVDVNYIEFSPDVASLMRLNRIDRFQSRGQQFCKLLGVKDSFNL